MTKKKKTYEEFHKHTRSQNKIITQDNFTYRLIIATIEKYLKSPKKILDIGCGAGTLSLYFANKGNTVLGIDISYNAVTQANQSAHNLNLKNAKFKKMNFPNEIPKEKFDFVIFTEVIEHLKDDDQALKNIFTLLKSGGHVFISTPSKNAPLHKMGLAAEFDKRVGHLRRYTLDELQKKVKKNGFIILETKKTEGIIRNFLFLNPIAGQFVRFIKYFLSGLVTTVDNQSLKFFGESNLFIVAEKPKLKK